MADAGRGKRKKSIRIAVKNGNFAYIFIVFPLQVTQVPAWGISANPGINSIKIKKQIQEERVFLLTKCLGIY
jgi:hypothetical protein